MYRKIILQYYVLSCFFNTAGMAVIGAVYVTFLLKNGLSLLEVNLVNAIFFVTLFACEIPTGAFADIFGRKHSFVLACGLISTGSLIYAFSHSFFGFACAEVIAAVGVTFKSGAFQAWLVDSLKHKGYTGSFTKIFARENLFGQIGTGAGAIIGSYCASYNPALPWFIGGVNLAVLAVIAQFTMKEEYFTRGIFSWKKGFTLMRDIALSSIRYGTQDKAVRFVLVVNFVQIFAVQALNMYWQPFFTSHGVKIENLGYLFAGMMFFLAIGSFLISHSHCEGREKVLILRIQVIVGLMVIAAVCMPRLPFMIAVFMLHETGRGCFGPLLSGYLQHRIPSHERATVASFCSIAPHIGGAIGLVSSGIIAQYAGLTVAWVVAGLVLIVGALCVAKNGNHSH